MNKNQNKIPDAWKWVTLDDIGIVVTGNTPSTRIKEYYQSDDIPFYKPTDLEQGINVINSKHYLSKFAEDVARIVPSNSVLVTCIGATIGKTGLLTKEGAFNQQINGIIHFINAKYLYYYCKTTQFQNELLNKASSTTIPILNKSKFELIKMPLAPLEEQNRIVEKIEELFSELDKNISQLNESKDKIEFSKTKILDKYYSSGFKEEKLDFLTTSIDYGYTAKSFTEKKNTESIHYLRITDIQNGEIIWDNVPFCEVDDKDVEKYSIKSNDILFARSGNTVGKTILVNNPPESLFASYLIRIRIKEQVLLPKFLYYYFQSNKYWQHINKNVTGIGQPNFNGTKLSNLSIPVPDLSDQKLIIQKIEEHFLELNNLEAELEISIRNTILLKSKILQDAFLGKLIKQLKSDTHSELLLKNIKNRKKSYLQEQQEKIKNRPKIKRMEKEKLSIIQVLEKHQNPISSKQLWEYSMYSDDIEKFYAELKKVQHIIRQEKSESETLISLK